MKHMKHAVIIRKPSQDYGTEGVFVCELFKCYSLELPDRNNRSNMSCIPAGTYIVKIRKSPRYGEVFHVKEVKKRTFILMHSGNYAGDIEKGLKTHVKGCIEFGRYRGMLHNQKAVLCSKPTVRALMSYMEKNDFKLTIHDGGK